jgi:hypothetical protein
MTFAEKIAVMRSVEALMHEGRIDEIANLVHPDFVVHEDPGMPYGGVYRGPDGFVRLVGNVVAAWDGLQTECLSFLDEPGGDGILLIIRNFGKAPGTGKPLEVLTSEYWRIVDGTLREGRVWYYDSPTAAAALMEGL